MLELAILCVIALAAVYWMALWLMGRHEDVLYGSFVTPAPGTAGNETAWPQRRETLRKPLPPELPRRPRVAAAPVQGGAPTVPATEPPRPSKPPRPLVAAPIVASAPARDHATSPALPLMAAPQRPAMAPPAPLAINPGALPRTAAPRSVTQPSAPPPTDVLAYLLETIKRDLSEATRR